MRRDTGRGLPLGRAMSSRWRRGRTGRGLLSARVILRVSCLARGYDPTDYAANEPIHTFQRSTEHRRTGRAGKSPLIVRASESVSFSHSIDGPFTDRVERVNQRGDA
jgi:hypothetical protein